MADAVVTQIDASVVTDSDGGQSQVSQADALILGIYPADSSQASQADALIPLKANQEAQASQAEAMVVALGRIDNRKTRVWAFSLDGHDFYVITLGENTTLVYDLTTGQWSEWTNENENLWRAHKGINWVGMGLNPYTHSYSNVVAGDYSFGVLWTLDPNIGYDEAPIEGGGPRSFTRKVIGGLQHKMRTSLSVGGAYLTASAGLPQVEPGSFQLRSSDDGGKSWANHGTIDITIGEYRQEYVWRSLGLIKQPGKLFEITDSGASVRIDSLDIR